MSKKFNAGTGWLGIGGKGKQRWYNRKDRQTYRIPSDKGNIYGPTLHTIHTPSYRPKKKGDTPGERLHGAPGDLELKPEEAIKQVTTKGQREVPWDKNKPRDENEVQGCVYLPPRDAIWVQQVITITGGRTWVTMEKGGPSFKADQTVTDYTSL